MFKCQFEKEQQDFFVNQSSAMKKNVLESLHTVLPPIPIILIWSASAKLSVNRCKDSTQYARIDREESNRADQLKAFLSADSGGFFVLYGTM